MNIQPNDGNRPSKLDLDRYATGELDGDARADLDAWLATDAAGQAHLDALEAARSEVAPFDAARLRARASAMVDEPPALPEPANNVRWMAWASLALLAALLLIGLLPVLGGTGSTDPGVDPDYVGVRGVADMQIFHLEAGELVGYDDRALGQGDVIGFKVEPASFRGVVVLSVDGRGQVSVFYPEAGDAPEPVGSNGLGPLPGSVILDDAPGPEVFVAVFDQTVSAARKGAEQAWQSGGATGLADWAAANGDVDLTVVHRR